MKRLIIFAVLLLVACKATFVECPDGSMAETLDACQQPTACPQDAKVCPDGSTVGRTGPDCTFAACPQVVGERVIEEGIEETESVAEGVEQEAVDAAEEMAEDTMDALPSHGDYALPEARQERREERMEESTKRLNLSNPEPLSDAMTIDAMNTQEVYLFDQTCESCQIKAHVMFANEGPKAGFGFVMRYDEEGPTFVFDRASDRVHLLNVTYDEEFREREGALPDEFDLSAKFTRDSIHAIVDQSDILRESNVGPMADGEAIGIFVRDMRVRMTNIEYVKWQ